MLVKVRLKSTQKKLIKLFDEQEPKANNLSTSFDQWRDAIEYGYNQTQKGDFILEQKQKFRAMNFFEKAFSVLKRVFNHRKDYYEPPPDRIKAFDDQGGNKLFTEALNTMDDAVNASRNDFENLTLELDMTTNNESKVVVNKNHFLGFGETETET